MTREVVVYPDRRLKSPAVAIHAVGPAALRLAAELAETARAYPRTVGLAAPQIGAMWRMIFVDCAGHKQVPVPRSPRILINPVVTHCEGSEVGREGCLSALPCASRSRGSRPASCCTRSITWTAC
jgi:peptide deformylase